MRPVVFLALGLALLAGPAPADDAGKAPPTAWGRPVGRYQAGLRVKPGGPAAGLAVSLQVVIRNVGRAPAGLRYESRQYVHGEEFMGTVTGRFRTPFGGGAGLQPFNRPALAPGAVEVVADWAVARPRPPAAPAPLSPGVATVLEPGTYRMGVERLQIGTPADDVVELGTGYLDVAVPSAK